MNEYGKETFRAKQAYSLDASGHQSPPTVFNRCQRLRNKSEIALKTLALLRLSGLQGAYNLHH